MEDHTWYIGNNMRCRTNRRMGVCKGNWLNNIDRAAQWYSLSDVEVVVRCQFVLGSDVVLSPHGTDNEFPRMNRKYREEVLANMNQMRLREDEHDNLMDSVSLQEGLDYEEEYALSASEESDNSKESGSEESDTCSEDSR